MVCVATSLPAVININAFYGEFTLKTHKRSPDAKATVSIERDYIIYIKPGEVFVSVINDDLQEKQIELALYKPDEMLTF